MYEPMKQVAMRFPKWLEEKRSSLSEQEIQQYVQTSRKGARAKLTVTSQRGLLRLLDDSGSANASKSSFMCTR
jgi:predicted DNA-binding transcriptional regulator